MFDGSDALVDVKKLIHTNPLPPAEGTTLLIVPADPIPTPDT